MYHHLDQKQMLMFAVLLSRILGIYSFDIWQLLILITRPLMKIRISRPRREFGHEGFSYIERDAGESNMEIKVTKTGYFTKKKVLEIGLQAAN